jgi:predicted Rossmann fold nucleotide-binding protein DprA/Smf involved in DNA uptake
MTNREFYLSVADGVVSAEVSEKARELLASLDARNEKRKSADSKEKRESALRRQTVLARLTVDAQTADDIVAQCNGLSVGQVRSALSALVRDGYAVKSEVKVDKARKMAYALSAEDATV